MYLSILGLFQLQSVKLNNTYVTCTFAEGSDAKGCETVLTCNTSIFGKAKIQPLTSLIELNPNLGYATGSIVFDQMSDCVTYDVLVYEVLSDGSVGASAVNVFSNITILPHSLPTSTYDGLPTPSRSFSSTTPTRKTPRRSVTLLHLLEVRSINCILLIIKFNDKTCLVVEDSTCISRL